VEAPKADTVVGLWSLHRRHWSFSTTSASWLTRSARRPERVSRHANGQQKIFHESLPRKYVVLEVDHPERFLCAYIAAMTRYWILRTSCPVNRTRSRRPSPLRWNGDEVWRLHAPTEADTGEHERVDGGALKRRSPGLAGLLDRTTTADAQAALRRRLRPRPARPRPSSASVPGSGTAAAGLISANDPANLVSLPYVIAR